MKFRFPLYYQIACLIAINIGAIILMRFCLLSGPNMGWQSVLYSPISERLQAVSFSLHHQFKKTPRDNWKDILVESGEYYNAKLYVYDMEAASLINPERKLPVEVMQRLTSLSMPPKPPHDFKQEGKVRKPFRFFGAPPPPHHRFFVVNTNNPDRTWLGVFIPLGDFETRMKPGVLIAESDNIWSTKLIGDYKYILFALVLLFVVSLLIWLPYIHRITSAIRQLTNATAKISDGKFDTKIDVKRADEIGVLSSSISKMSSRLNAYVTGQKRFLGDIAHELSSPVARQLMALELLEQNADEKQKEQIKDIKEEAEQMSALINELLAFSKAGVRGKEIKLERVDLNASLKEAVKNSAPQSIVSYDVPDNVYCRGNEVLLVRAFSNILRNSVKYAGDESAINIDVHENGQEVILKISDNGPGVPEESLEQLGEPFYRPDAARSRSAGGVGLGLAIVKTCIETCDGKFGCKNRPEGGLEVSMRLKKG